MFMKNVFGLVLLALVLIPALSFGASYSTYNCTSNSTLQETIHHTFVISENESENIFYIEYKNTTCDYGCVLTGSMTAECHPKPFDMTLIITAFIVILLIALIILSRHSH